MDYADLINALETTIVNLQGLSREFEVTLSDLDFQGVPGTDVTDEDVRRALRILTEASARIA